MIPILIRSKDRVEYLHATLKSLTASFLNDTYIVIADDCSTTDDMNKFLFSNDKIVLRKNSWADYLSEINQKASNFFNHDEMTNEEIFNKYLGNLQFNKSFNGILNKFTVIQPEQTMGDLCGLYWTMMAGFEMFKNADRIIILEDDIIFNKNWLNITNFIYENEKLKNPGLISVYNRDNDGILNEKLYKSIDNLGGVMYLIPRNVYQYLTRNKLLILDIKQDKNIAGDTHLQNTLIKAGFNFLNTNESYIQHIGITSLVRPGRFLRYSRSFLQPFAWNEDF